MHELFKLQRFSLFLMVFVTLAKALSLFEVHGCNAHRANFCEKDLIRDFSMSEHTNSSSPKNQRVFSKRESIEFEGVVILNSFNIKDDDFVSRDADVPGLEFIAESFALLGIDDEDLILSSNRAVVFF